MNTPRAIQSIPGNVAHGDGEPVTYRFTSLSPTILNCQVLGPQNETRFWVVTEGGVPSCTLLKNPMGAKVALINWQTAPPQIDLPGLVTRQVAAQWLCLTPDRGSRHMTFNGICYFWTPLGRDLHLYTLGNPVFLAKISKTPEHVALEFTPRALQLGLFEVCILATILLQSGRRIE